jgi:hypothetical protein
MAGLEHRAQLSPAAATGLAWSLMAFRLSLLPTPCRGRLTNLKGCHKKRAQADYCDTQGQLRIFQMMVIHPAGGLRNGGRPARCRAWA